MLHDEPPGVHGYGVDTICLYLRLVMNGVSLRGGGRVLALLAEALEPSLEIPHWTTGRLWLMRLDHAMLTMPLEQADDWAWLADHSVQIGQEKCLVILGVRLRELPPPGACLDHRDLRLITLVPRTSWTRQEVAQALEEAVQRTGVPCVIVQVVNVAVEHVNRHGVSRFSGRELERALPRPFAHPSTEALASDLVLFVTTQGQQTKPGQRFPGSTEVLESCFGKMKQLEKQQSRGGFTSLLISFGAILADLTSQTIEAALKHSATKQVYQWCQDHLGTTVFGKRKLAFANSATKTG